MGSVGFFFVSERHVVGLLGWVLAWETREQAQGIAVGVVGTNP